MPDEIRIVIHKHGTVVYGEIPLDIAGGLIRGLAIRYGEDAIMPTAVAEATHGTCSICAKADMDAFLKELDIRPDHSDWLKSGDTGDSSPSPVS